MLSNLIFLIVIYSIWGIIEWRTKQKQKKLIDERDAKARRVKEYTAWLATPEAEAHAEWTEDFTAALQGQKGQTLPHSQLYY